MKKLLLAAVCLFLTACGTMGLQEPQTLEERIAYAVGTNTGIREASTEALNLHQISSSDMEHIIKLNDQVKAGMDAARLLVGSDPTTAEGRYLATLKILKELQAYTRSRGIKSSHNEERSEPWQWKPVPAWT